MFSFRSELARPTFVGSLLTLVLCSLLSPAVLAQQWRPLWPDGAPGALGERPEDVPALLFYPAAPERATGCGIVVCPGGGYAGLAMDHEGYQIADWLNQRGITAWILRYRLGTHGYHHPIQRGDVLRAMRVVRHEAQGLGVDPDRIGIWGFSAGGHLASTAATHFDGGDSKAADPIDRLSSRPDFAVLCYPVITLEEPLTHSGSRKNLLGADRSEDGDLVALLSNERRVTEDTPPTFIFNTVEDQAVPVENALKFFSALRAHGVNSSELHVYQTGRHGVGLAGSDPVLSSWPDRLFDWLKVNGFSR
jgi:acetyl esterase/lipase